MLCDDMMSPAAGSEEADTPHQSAPAVEVAKGPGDQVSSFSFFLAVANSNYIMLKLRQPRIRNCIGPQVGTSREDS